MNTRQINTQLFLFFTAIALVAVVVLVVSTVIGDEEPTIAGSRVSPYEDYVDAAGNITLPEDFVLDWVHMGAWAIAEDGKVPDMHSVYAPKEVVEYYKDHGEFEDGAIMIKEVRHARGSDHTTGQAHWVEGVKVWFVMIKDTRERFPDNPLWGDGWGWALFKGDDPTTQAATDYKSDCLGCHIPAENTDWIYIYGYPVLGASVKDHAPTSARDSMWFESPDKNVNPAVTFSSENVERGKKVYGRCKSCHSLEPGQHRIGPSLAGVFGREAGTAEGYKYSKAMLESKVIWSAEALDNHLLDVPGFIPGNRMGKMYKNGVKDPADRTAVIEFLRVQ